jgi:hypothetical protein
MPYVPDDTALLKPHERLRELATILAGGFQRCRTGLPVAPESAANPAKSLKNQPNSSRNGLEFLSSSRPDGRCQPETTREE